MKIKSWPVLPVILMLTILVSGCEAIGSIFKAGVWTGMIGVILILLIIIFVIVKIFSKKKDG